MSGKALGAIGLLVCAVTLEAACGGGGAVVVTDGGSERTERPARRATAEEDFEEAAAMWEAPEPRDLDEIADLLESAVEKDPSFSRAWFDLGVVREQQGEREEAIRAYRQSNAVDSAFVDGLANVGAMMLEDGRVSEAEQLLGQVVAVDQFHPGANLNLARIHRMRAHEGGAVRRDEADEAINRIRQSLAGDAMNVAAYETLAAVYYDLSRYQLARLVCVNAIELGLESAELYNRLGLILLAEDDVTGAYAQFRRAVTLDPALVEASMNQGAIALNYRDYAGALEAFDRALAHDPDNIDAMLSRGVALRGTEDLVGADAAYEAILERDPNNLAAIYNLGVLYQEYYQDYETAVEWFRRFVSTPGAERSSLYDDVTVRIDVLNELIELLQESDEGAAPADSGTMGPVEEGVESEPPADEGGVPAPID